MDTDHSMSDTNSATRPDTIEARILEVLSSIRPAIRADGGDIELVQFDEQTGRVDIRMVGACYACPMSMLTLKAGIEQRLRMIVPEVQTVESV
jgi:Fe-S cluster biogenesis protein NfuA